MYLSFISDGGGGRGASGRTDKEGAAADSYRSIDCCLSKLSFVVPLLFCNQLTVVGSGDKYSGLKYWLLGLVEVNILLLLLVLHKWTGTRSWFVILFSVRVSGNPKLMRCPCLQPKDGRTMRKFNPISWQFAHSLATQHSIEYYYYSGTQT